ncbi:MAG: hypothetical protein JXA52_01950 [Planctomycetes bacterium]|nr:hypothetical protein [Planctomycetota bacterium]
MTFDDLRTTWQSQASACQPKIDLPVLLQILQRAKRDFAAMILRRDVLEVAIAFLMFLVFLNDYSDSREWPLLLLASSCLFVGGFMVIDRFLQKRKAPKLFDPLQSCIKESLTAVNHQIWLLKNVFWWYLLPPGIGVLTHYCYIGFKIIPTLESTGAAFGIVCFVCVVGITMMIFWWVYNLNQNAVEKELLPRKQELEQLLENLQ